MSGKAVAKAFGLALGGFVAGDYLSNFMLHPGQKLDHGILNKLVGREVRNKFWGTRLEHYTVLPAYLAAADVLSVKLWSKWAAKKGTTFGLKTTPLAMLTHCMGFAVGGIMAYVIHNAVLNPGVESGKRMKFIADHVYPTVTGCFSMLAFPITAAGCGALAGMVPSLSYLFTNVTTGTWHFFLVKSTGFLDHRNPSSLTEYEKEMNGYIKKEEAAWWWPL